MANTLGATRLVGFPTNHPLAEMQRTTVIILTALLRVSLMMMMTCLPRSTCNCSASPWSRSSAGTWSNLSPQSRVVQIQLTEVAVGLLLMQSPHLSRYVTIELEDKIYFFL